MKKLAMILCASAVFSLNADLISVAERDLHEQDFKKSLKYSKEEFDYFSESDFEIDGIKPKLVSSFTKKDGKYDMIMVSYSKEDFPKIKEAIDSKFKKIHEKDNGLYQSETNIIVLSCVDKNDNKGKDGYTGITISRKGK